MEQILIHFLIDEITTYEDFTVYRKLWPSSQLLPFTNLAKKTSTLPFSHDVSNTWRSLSAFLMFTLTTVLFSSSFLSPQYHLWTQQTGSALQSWKSAQMGEPQMVLNMISLVMSIDNVSEIHPFVQSALQMWLYLALRHGRLMALMESIQSLLFNHIFLLSPCLDNTSVSVQQSYFLLAWSCPAWLFHSW